MHIPITRRIRRVVDESLVHCHRGCELEPCQHTFFVFSIIYFYQFIYLFKDKTHNHFQTIWLLNIALMTTNTAYPIELMHLVASCICVFVFDNVHLMDTLYKCLNYSPIMLKGYM